MKPTLLLIPLFVLAAGCGGKPEPDVDSEPLPDTAWPELSLLLEATEVVETGPSSPETTLLEVFQRIQSAAHRLLRAGPPKHFDTPEVQDALGELAAHQERMLDLGNLDPEALRVYRALALRLAEPTLGSPN